MFGLNNDVFEEVAFEETLSPENPFATTEELMTPIIKFEPSRFWQNMREYFFLSIISTVAIIGTVSNIFEMSLI